MKFKKIVSFGLAALMALSMVTTCSAAEAASVKGANQDPANTQTSDETLRVGFSAEPSSIWMGGTGKSENEMAIINSAIMDRLVNIDRSTGEVVPMLASSWEWVDDTHCKFTLRDDVTMSDGTPLVADDVVYSVNTWMETSANSDTGRFLAGAVADDEHTVTIEFNTVAPELVNMLSWGNFGIVSEDEVNALGGIEAAAKNPQMGCGRYKFKEWKNGQSITLERNDDYYDDNYTAYYKDIVLTFTSDAAARAMAVQSGDLNVAFDMPISMANTYMNDDKVDVVMDTIGQNVRLFYNMGPKAGATADEKVRRAIDKALDFDAISAVGTAGTREPVLGYFPEDSKYYNETFTKEERAVDVEGAKELLEEAGYGDGLDLTIVGIQDQNPVFTVMQENLRQVGINLTINIYDTAQFVEVANGGDYDLIHVGDLVDARYPTIMSSFQQSMIDTFCIGGPKYTTPEVEEDIKTLIQEPDEAKAKEEAGALEQVWKDGMWFSNTYAEMRAEVITKGLKGYNSAERGFIDLTGFYME